MVVFAADVNNDGADDYLVGTPGEDQLNAGGPSDQVPGEEITDAGAININYANSAAPPQMWHQDSTSNGIGVSDDAEKGDGFGGHLLDEVFANLFPLMYSLTL